MAELPAAIKPGFSRTENRLTDTALRKTKLPDTGNLPINDGGGIRGILTEAGARRVARLSFHFKIDYKQHELYLGTWPDTSLAEMRAKRDHARNLARQGINPIEAAKAEKAAAEQAKAEAEAARAIAEAKPTVKDVFDRWDRLHLSQAYKDGGAEVRRYFTTEILPALGDAPIDSLTRANVAAVVDNVLARGKPSAAKALLGCFRQFLRWSVARGYLDTDPSAALAKSSIKTNGPRERVLSAEEVKLLPKLLPAAGLPKWAPHAVWVILATACRVSELLESRWDDFDLDNREWRIPDTKSGRPHVVDLSDFAILHLRELDKLRNGPFLVNGRQTGEEIMPISDKALTKSLKDRQRPAGFVPLKNRTITHPHALNLPGGPWTPHDLRRSAATFMQGLGVLPVIIERCLNHAEPNSLIRVYQRYDYRPERKDAFNRLGHHLEELAKGKPGTVVSFAKREAA